MKPRFAFQPFAPASTSRCKGSRLVSRSRSGHICAAVGAKTEADAHVQLATALLPKDVAVDTFIDRLYQWAATVTSSGRNLPLALPLRVSRLPQGRGFEMSFLRMRETSPVSVADITASVEDVAGKGQVLFLRLYDAEGTDLVVGDRHRDASARVQALSQALVDIPTVMNSMPPAIKLAVVQSRS